MEPMGDCVEYTLGPAALEFMKDRRLARGHTFARCLLQVLDLDSGRVSVFFPPGLSLDQLQEDFEGGGILPFPPQSEWRSRIQEDGRKVRFTPVPYADSDLIATILEHLRSSEENLCIMENAMHRPTDLWLSRAEMRKSRTLILRDGDEVYHLVQGTSTGTEYVKRAKGEADTGFMLIGALTSLSSGSGISTTRAEVTSEQLRLMAERTVKIFVGAYDGEGYLIWHRAETPKAVGSDQAE